MIRLAALVLLATIYSTSYAQNDAICEDFQKRSGTEFLFKTDDIYKKYGFQSFHDSLSSYKSAPYESLAGRRGKVVGSYPGLRGLAHVHEVFLDDCRTVYWRDTNDQLEPGDALSAGITFIDQPPTYWVVREETDRMTDAKSCVVTPKSDMPYPMFFHHSIEGFSVQVVGGNFPGRPTTFRVDKNKAISEIEGLSGSRAQALAAQIRSGGKQLLVGSYGWPDDYEVLKEFNLSGLTELLNGCKIHVRSPQRK